MEKKAHQYKLTLEYLENNNGESMDMDPIELKFDNHDDIFKIVQMQQERNLFGNKNQSAEFAIGLKLFSEVMLKNRNNPLFEELLPAFGAFMKKLKGK